jgi:chemosensory pili system protein ChpB (putative protein-glutamate methylesterase)
VLTAWAARLTGKLQQLGIARGDATGARVLPRNPVVTRANAKSSQHRVARHVWVLGASLGGPEAVTEFLHALPADLPLCFVYAQHIEPNFSGLLAEVMGRNTDLNTRVLGADSVLSHGRLGVVPVETELRFRPLGRIEDTCKTWPGSYAPSIDQVISDIAGLYGDCSGAIIFSGMGEDGAASCELVQGRGGSVWAQRPDTCICASMPEAAIDTGSVEYQASPAQMAQALAQRYTRSPLSLRSLQVQDQL